MSLSFVGNSKCFGYCRGGFYQSIRGTTRDFVNPPRLNYRCFNMKPEYNFVGKKGVRGKYYRAYRKGHKVKIEREDGTVTVQYFTLEDGAVMQEPDVRKYFPDSEAVNKALRSLISLIPSQPPKRKDTTNPDRD